MQDSISETLLSFAWVFWGTFIKEYSWGRLLFALDPPPKIFIDCRADMYREKVFYAKLTYIHPDTEELLAQYNIDWTLYPKDSFLVR